jgi:hypothetical protein
MNHPHIRAIIRALDRAEESEQTHPDCGIVRTTAGLIFEWGRCVDRFAADTNWTDEQARAVVLSWALHCPDDELRWMAETAREQMKAIADWDRADFYLCYGREVPRSKRQRAQLDAEIAAEEMRLAQTAVQ